MPTLDWFRRTLPRRYGLAAIVFGVTIGVSLSLAYYEAKLNLTGLIVVALVITAWYGGRGPGIVLSVALTGVSMAFGKYPTDIELAKAAFSYVSVLGLLIFIVLIISGRRTVIDKLRFLNETLEQRVDERTAELAAANHELQSFAYSVSHDLRGPLRHMNGFSQMLIDEHADRLDDRGHELLGGIQDASARMSHLIDDLLKLSNVTRRGISRDRVDLSSVVNGIASGLADSEPARTANFQIEDGVVVRGDESLLRIAMQNLLENAWKFSANVPMVSINFGSRRNGPVTEYFVRDNGAGFRPEHAEKIFEPFERLHDADQFSGNGIGLAIVDRVVRRHGGTIRAEGKPDQGAAFYFTLSNG